MILHLISRGQHCLSQLDTTYTCPNFGEYGSVIDRLRGTLLEIVEKLLHLVQFLHRGNADIVRGTFLGSLAFGVSSGVAGDPRDKTTIAKLRWNQMEPIHTLLSIQN